MVQIRTSRVGPEHPCLCISLQALQCSANHCPGKGSNICWAQFWVPGTILGVCVCVCVCVNILSFSLHSDETGANLIPTYIGANHSWGWWLAQGHTENCAILSPLVSAVSGADVFSLSERQNLGTFLKCTVLSSIQRDSKSIRLGLGNLHFTTSLNGSRKVVHTWRNTGLDLGIFYRIEDGWIHPVWLLFIYILLPVFPVCVAFMCISVVLGAAPSSHQTPPALLMQWIMSSPSRSSGLIHFCLHGPWDAWVGPAQQARHQRDCTVASRWN